MEQHNLWLKFPLENNIFTWDAVDENANNGILVFINHKKYKVIFDKCFILYLNNEEIASFEESGDVLLFLLA